jgi:hypothetical protein
MACRAGACPGLCRAATAEVGAPLVGALERAGMTPDENMTLARKYKLVTALLSFGTARNPEAGSRRVIYSGLKWADRNSAVTFHSLLSCRRRLTAKHGNAGSAAQCGRSSTDACRREPVTQCSRCQVRPRCPVARAHSKVNTHEPAKLHGLGGSQGLTTASPTIEKSLTLRDTIVRLCWRVVAASRASMTGIGKHIRVEQESTHSSMGRP